jgi:hypothetical protein
MDLSEAPKSLFGKLLVVGSSLVLASVGSMAQVSPRASRPLSPWKESLAPGAKGTHIRVPKPIFKILNANPNDCPPETEPERAGAFLVRGGQTTLVAIRGQSSCYCGATGNCQLWIYRRLHGKYEELLQTGNVSGFGFLKSKTNGLPDLVIWSHDSAQRSPGALWKFDGTSYESHYSWEWTTQWEMPNGDWEDSEPHIVHNTCGGTEEQPLEPEKK